MRIWGTSSCVRRKNRTQSHGGDIDNISSKDMNCRWYHHIWPYTALPKAKTYGTTKCVRGFNELEEC